MVTVHLAILLVSFLKAEIFWPQIGAFTDSRKYKILFLCLLIAATASKKNQLRSFLPRSESGKTPQSPESLSGCSDLPVKTLTKNTIGLKTNST